MSLPKLMKQKYTITLPSNGQEVSFRPFLVKEEKILLMANEANDDVSKIMAIKEAIEACCDVDVAKLPYFDVEYLFLHLRAKSIGEEITYKFMHQGSKNREGKECHATTDVSVNIDDVKVQFSDDHKSKFMINKEYGVKMKHPSIDDIAKMTKDIDNRVALIASCIEYVYDSEDVHYPDSIKDSIQFIEQMNSGEFGKLTEWLESIPVLRHEIKYKCAGCGQEDTVTFEGVSDFF